MGRQEAGGRQPRSRGGRPYRVQVPGFLAKGEVGLGDVVKHVTTAVGIKPCAGCQRRAAALNRYVVFTGQRGR